MQRVVALHREHVLESLAGEGGIGGRDRLLERVQQRREPAPRIVVERRPRKEVVDDLRLAGSSAVDEDTQRRRRRSGVVPGRTLQDVVRALHCLRICRRWRWVGDGARAGQQRERERACQRAKPADEQRPVQEVAAGAAIRCAI